jgi:alkylation response protein AidB-like acyl-CoA dehydrogenase
MDLSLTSDQRLLVDTARSFLQDACPIEHVRAMERDERGFDPRLWREMARLGWLGMELSAEYGGSGQTFLDSVLLLEEMGRVLLPGPFLSTCVVAAPLLLALGECEPARRSLRALAFGDAIVTMAAYESGRPDEWQSPQLTVRSDANGHRLSGIKRFVPFAPHSDLILVVARTKSDAPCVVAVEPGSAGLSHARLATLGGDHTYEVRFEDVLVPPATLGEEKAGAAVEQALARATVGSLAYAVGAAERVLEMTVDYAKTRAQFGRPIGSFQAVSHRCVDMRSDIDASRYLVYQAAWSLAAGRPSECEVSTAKAYGNEALQRIFKHAHQVHGAIGFSTEHDLQLFTRRAKAVELQWGSTSFHAERVARAMGL